MTAQLNPGGGKVLFTDNETDLSVAHTYRLSAINSCNIPVISSNPASTLD